MIFEDGADMIGTLLTMSSGELDKLDWVKKVLEKRITQKDAAKHMGISSRHLRRLLKEYKTSGVLVLISKRRGKASNRAYSGEFKQSVLECVKINYTDFGPTLAAEKLLERDELKVSKETLRQWMVEAGFWKGKKRKKIIVHQQRPRRTSVGELVQIDGSPHDWFEDRGPRCCLLVFVDDATSRLMHLEFVLVESALGYFQALLKYILKHGRPLAFYCDKHGIFRVNHKEAESGTGETQFARAMRELDIELICANSAQAKGRVERMNLTMQDRLIKEMRLENISDIDTANKFVPKFIKKYNQQFSVPPANPDDVHRASYPSEEILSLIFTHQETRCLSKNLELSYKNIIYQIKTKGKGYGLRKARVTVCDDYEGKITLLYKNRKLDYEIYDKKNQPIVATPAKELNVEIDKRSQGHKPKADHPWRKYVDKTKQKTAA